VSEIQQNPANAKQAVPENPQLIGSFVSQFTMRDGTQVKLRPICSDDEPLMKQFHETLSDRTVYMRYFHSLSLKSRVTHERLVRICHMDGDREMALVVDCEDKATGLHLILAVGRLMRLSAQDEAEVAILVSDRYQKQDLGIELLRRLVQIARDQKLSRVRAVLLRDNLAMQNILQKLGFRFCLLPDSPSITAILELRLPAITPWQ
jgi:acetyltransferase